MEDAVARRVRYLRLIKHIIHGQNLIDPVVRPAIDGFGITAEKNRRFSHRDVGPPQFARLEKYFAATHACRAPGMARSACHWTIRPQQPVGHLTIGNWKIIHDLLSRISSAIKRRLDSSKATLS